ncbi:MAG: cytochrome P450 [Sandaracinus sp.]
MQPTLPPGPRWPALVQTVQYATHTREHLLGLHARYGDFFTIHALNGPVALACTPALAKEVFTADAEHYSAFAVQATRSVLGSRSVLVTHGAEHKRQRKLIVPPFHGARMRAYGEAMLDAARERTARWTPGMELRIHDEAMAMSFDVILRTVFGASEGQDAAEARETIQRLLDAFDPILLFTPRTHHPLVPAWRRFLRARQAFDEFVVRCLARRRASEGGTDIASMLLAARTEEGAALDDAEIGDHLLALLVAGQETTAIALSWMIYLVFRHPDVLSKVRAELDAARDAEPDAIAKLPYLSAIWDETLRLEPVLADVIRTVASPLEIGGHLLPVGSNVGVAIDVIHRDPTLYPEPERFRPERFLERRMNAFEHLPFGGGHRRCIGAAFAEYEGKLVFASLVSRFDFELRSVEHRARRNVTLAPAHGVRVVVRPRASAS